MKDFDEFLEKNKDKAYAAAYANSKHDKAGHCLFPQNDPWMNDTCWDHDFIKMEDHG